MSSIGIDFDGWDEANRIGCDNGAVFFMDPAHGASMQPVVFAQLTVPSDVQFAGQISAQGRSVQHGAPLPEDWKQESIPFSSDTTTHPAPCVRTLLVPYSQLC